MEQVLLDFITSQGPSVAILAVGGAFFVRYFMSEIAKKDVVNQENTNRFITLSEKYIEVTTKMNDTINNIHPKLNEIHEDVKLIKGRKRGV